MSTCSSYDQRAACCMGTRERDRCDCGGDQSKCDFYPEIREKHRKTPAKKQSGQIDLKINIDDEQLQDTADMLKEINDNRPNITVRNNENVYVTINYFNEPAKEDETRE